MVYAGSGVVKSDIVDSWLAERQLSYQNLAYIGDDLNDLSVVKNQYGVRREFSSCHTAIVEGYVVEGHVPTKYVDKLLAERPEVAGITVPGMPIGSPGMEGPNPQPYDVLSFDAEGKTAVFGSVRP